MGARGSKTIKNIRLTATLGFPVVLVMALDGIAHADPGLNLSLGVSQRLESGSSDGPDTDAARDTGTRSVTRLNLGLESLTRTQTLSFQTGTALIYNLDNSDEIDVEDPLLRLNYAIQNQSSQLSFAATYRRAQLDDSVFFDENLDEEIVTGGGTRETASLQTSLTLGRDSPTTFTLNHEYRETNFADTAQDEEDQIRNSVDATLNFTISPVLSTQLSASFSELDEDGPDAVDTTRTSVRVGATYTISPTLQVSGQISQDETESDDGNNSSGLGFSLSAQQSLQSGTLGASLSATETLNGTRRQAQISRSLAFSRGSLSASFGVSQTGDLDLAPLANLSLDYALSKDSNVSVGLSQSARINNDNEETVSTRLNANYSKSLTSLSSLSVGFQLAAQDAQAENQIDESSARLNITYRYGLGDSWDLVSGASISDVRRDGDDDTTTRQVFLGIERNFSFRP